MANTLSVGDVVFFERNYDRTYNMGLYFMMCDEITVEAYDFSQAHLSDQNKDQTVKDENNCQYFNYRGLSYMRFNTTKKAIILIA